LQDCIATAAHQTPSAVYQEPWTKARQHLERRTVCVFGPQEIRAAGKWRLGEALVSVERNRRVFDPKIKKWNPADETSFYISTTRLTAREFGPAIRWHWGLENRNHYVRDVSLGEDWSRIRLNPHIFATLRSFALNILRVNKVQNVKLELFENCMNLDRVLNYVGIA